MFEKYNEKARRALFFARYEASKLGSKVIESEHILLGILREGEDIIKEIFARFNVKPDDIRREIEGDRVFVERVSSTQELPLSEESKKILAYASHEAESMMHPYVGTEHLLIGILRVDPCVAARLLSGARVQPVRRPRGDDRPHQGARGLQAEEGAPVPRRVRARPDGARRTRGRSTRSSAATRRSSGSSRSSRGGRRTTRSSSASPASERRRSSRGSRSGSSRATSRSSSRARRSSRWTSRSSSPGRSTAGSSRSGSRGSSRSCKENQDLIIFIDEIHSLIGAGSAEGSLDAANILKPALSRGEIACIGATTLKEYRKYIEKDRSLLRRFQAITVHPPSEEETLEILEGVRERYERFHRVRYTPDAVRTAVYQSNRYIPDRFFPDKAIDILDEAGREGEAPP